MAESKNTIFQSIGDALLYGFDKNVQQQQKRVRSYTINNDETLLKTKDKNEYEKTKLQLKQEKYLANQWYGASLNLGQAASLVTNNLLLMYRDADIMDGFPEIGAALDTYMEESCTTNSKGQILNISSKSDRIKKILEDLFVNRLNIHVNLPMWVRGMCKYGNSYILLNITEKNGVIGGRQLPVYEIERVENGAYNPYLMVPNTHNQNRDTEFVWMGQNSGMPFKNWQIAHFRLLNDSLFLPYGVSILNKARRHFRILSMMEDMMLIYRLERSIERRVFKIFVGNIDDPDIPAYVQEIANSFKRTPIIDPETGQLDLKKNVLDASHDIFIPVRDMSAPNPIDTLPAASNLDKIEDLKYIQNKVFAALRMPKEFLNFEDAAGDGKNLAIKDIRFTRTINRVQQSIIMELTKIATIHLYLMGFKDELTNFKITMNSPSTQAELLRLEELSKRIQLANSAVQDPGNGIQIYSLTRAQREILGWTDEEITQNMLEIRMEKALAAELAKTEQIIKRTGLFDKIDHLYGVPNAEYATAESGEVDEGGMPGGGGGGSFGADFSSGIEGSGGEGEEMPAPEEGSPELGGGMTSPGTSELPPVEGSVPPTEEEPQKMESILKHINKLLVENKIRSSQNINRIQDAYLKKYISYLNKGKNIVEEVEITTPIIDKAFIKNEEINDIVKILDKKINDKKNKNING